MRKHIYDKDWRYSFLRIFWTDWAIRHSYRKFEVHGGETVPEDGAIILCANHCNTLMDALVVLCSHHDKMVFGARADLFRRPFIAKLMSFVRILPMVRQRDGLRNVLQNNQTQDIIVEIIEHDTRFCLFPEGSHRTKHSLQRLGKGAFRIALAANAKFGGQKPVYLVPIGLEYGDYFRYRSTCLINYGQAVNVTKFLEEGNFAGEQQAIEALRQELSRRMEELITYIPDDENYDSKWALTKMDAIYKSKKGYGQFGTKLDKAMLKNRKTVAKIEAAMDEQPEKMAALLERVSKFEKKRLETGVSIYSFRKMNPVANMIGKGFAALIGLPYFIFSAITSLPLWVASMMIRKSVKDPAFRNTVSFGVKLSLGDLIILLYAALAFCLAPWWMALIFIALYLPAYSYFHDYLEGCRRWFSDIRLYRRKELYKEFKHIMKDFLHITK
jgi:1-acyl-sn-glycerol-3-phosphate acyltransferase